MDMLNYGKPLGLATLKACVEEHHKQQVPEIMDRLVEEGKAVRLRKDLYQKVESNGRP